MKVKVCKLKEIGLLTENKNLEVGKDTIEPILPTYGKEGDCCMDIYPIYCERDLVKDRIIYHTGLAFNVGGTKDTPNEMEIRPRSNFTKSNWYIPNAPGTLDYGYRGELLVIMKNRTSYNILELFKSIRTDVALKNNTRQAFDAAYRELYNEVNSIPYQCNGEDRCCQIKINQSVRVEWDEVKSIENLGASERGAGGFGSTGGAVK